MASIQTGIELNDQFTNVIYGIINSVNLAVSGMNDMQQAMNANVDTSSIEGARDEINQAAMAANELVAALQNQSVINVDVNPITPNPLVENPEPIRPEIQPNAPPEPVEIPVQWDMDGLAVFTGTGIERFEQEVQSTNDMLNTLNSTQMHIQQTASSMDILPDVAVQDINSMGQRLQSIQQQIQLIESNPVNMGTVQANMELEQLRSQLNQALQSQNDLNTAMQRMDVSSANTAYMRLSQSVSGTERYIRDNIDAQGRFNQEIQEGTNQSDGLMTSIKGAVAAYVSIQTMGKVLNISDELVQTTSRLGLMNDGLQSTQELTNMVYAAAQDARGSFSEMSDVVARFGNNAKDAFGSSAEVVDFANLIQKQMTIAGASTQESSNAMLQLSQALGSGVLRGDELNSIFEQAPNLIGNIADYLDVPIGQIRDMASEGELSADIVKAAIFSASDEINAKFAEMPMTFGQIWQSFQNTAMMAFQPVLQRLNDIANSEAFQSFVNGAIEAMAVLSNVVLNIFDLIGSVGGFIADNWSIIEPIVLGVAAAMGIYTAALIANNVAQGISNIIKGIATLQASAHSVALMLESGATFTATAAQWGLNAALYACPIVWIIILVIALIAVFYAAVAAINHFAGTSISATGVICGSFLTVLAVIGNVLVTLINFVLDIFVAIWNFIAAFANFLGNVFNDPVGSIARLFFDLADVVLGVLEALASAMDTLLGSDVAGAISGWRDDLGGWVDDTFGKGTEFMAQLDAKDLHWDRFDYSDAYNTGYDFGKGDDNMSSFGLSGIFNNTDIPNPEDYMNNSMNGADTGMTNALDNTGASGNLDNISGSTGAIADSMNVSSEELKYLRDIAEQESTNRYTTAEVNVDMSGMQNTIKNGSDLTGFMSDLTDSVNEAVDRITEGVHK